MLALVLIEGLVGREGRVVAGAGSGGGAVGLLLLLWRGPPPPRRRHLELDRARWWGRRWGSLLLLLWWWRWLLLPAAAARASEAVHGWLSDVDLDQPGGFVCCIYLSYVPSLRGAAEETKCAPRVNKYALPRPPPRAD